MPKTSQIVLNRARAVTPRFCGVWHESCPSVVSQRVIRVSSPNTTCVGSMRRLAEIYDRHSRLNPFNSAHDTRLRQYFDCMFAEFAKGGKKRHFLIQNGPKKGAAPLDPHSNLKLGTTAGGRSDVMAILEESHTESHTKKRPMEGMSRN
jgi:hypothetical protein